MVFNHITDLFFLLIISYLLGSIPSGLILSKIFYKKDIRRYGSGNIGATNVFRECGIYIASITLMLDFLKGMSVIIIAKAFEYDFPVLYGFVSVIGHIFPVWLKFRGGKGIATVSGVLVALNPFIFIIMLIIWILLFKMYHFSSLASLLSISLSIMILVATYKSYTDVFFAILTLLLIIYRHKDNIYRLCMKKESKIYL